MEDDNSKHLRAYKDLVKVIEYYGGDFFQTKKLFKYETDKATKESRTLSESEAKVVGRNKLQAVG